MPSPCKTPGKSQEDETPLNADTYINTQKRKDTSKQLTLADCQQCIENALADKRISCSKYTRLSDCLKSESPTEIIYQLICENIPNKRSKTTDGYKCKLCVKPLKGHVCPYCPVCSTPYDKHAKDGEHACFNCPQCFEAGRKKKRLVQIQVGTETCPHGKEKGEEAAVALISLQKGL